MTRGRGPMFAALALLLSLQALATARADPDEAWLHRAELPAGIHPLLVLVMDTSAAAARTIRAAPAYDPARDYAAYVPEPLRCDPARVYWRRGPGPAPDCLMQSGLEAAGGGAPRAFECEAARASLTRQGFFIASRAGQWRAGGPDGRWTALAATSTGAVECRADRARHGDSLGAWYAADGPRGPWSASVSNEIRWDRAPLADPYVFYLGNYLNYLRATLAPREIAISDLARQSLAGALRATDAIDAALLRFAADADGGYVARAAAPADAVAADLEAMSDDASEHAAPLGKHSQRQRPGSQAGQSALAAAPPRTRARSTGQVDDTRPPTPMPAVP